VMPCNMSSFLMISAPAPVEANAAAASVIISGPNFEVTRRGLPPALARGWGAAGQGQSLTIAMTTRSAQDKLLGILAAVYYF
jgi:hypothetical protein